MTVSFDPSVVQVGDVFGSDFDVISESIDNTLGTVSLLASNSEEGLTGSFVIAELLFEAVTDDDSGCTLSVTGSELLSDDASPITIDHTCDDGWLEIFSDDQTGDMNGDGKVNSGDVRYLGMFLAGDPAYSPLYADGDVNGDGNVNSGDVRYLGMFLAGDPDYHPLYP
jgi:hypothetical protein